MDQSQANLPTDFGQSPLRKQAPLPIGNFAHTSQTQNPDQPEPLLSLLTSQHPLVASAINGSMSAYTSSKSYSRGFKYGAEFIERNIGSPVASTVGTVGRRTGVEGVARWALQRRDSTDNIGPSKRRRVGEEEQGTKADVEKGLATSMTASSMHRRASDLSFAEPLPAYDDQRSPQYEEVGPLIHTTDGQVVSQQGWKGRLAIHTSGLGVAMSEESLRNLKYCLTWLRWANSRLGSVILALKNVIREWDQSGSTSQHDMQGLGPSTSKSTPNGQSRSAPAAFSQRVEALKSDVLATLKKVVDIVSTYAGGALPDNARILVRRHLTSLPQRFRIASSSSPAGEGAETSETALSAHRVMVLAQEGLGMMSQVSLVVNDTLVSAESWCDKLGRRRAGSGREREGNEKGLLLVGEQGEGEQPRQTSSSSGPDSGDVQMTGHGE